MRQEACRKDVERAFGVLQARFAILKMPAKVWNKDIMTDIMKACIIMHNMIVEDERELGDDIGSYEHSPSSVQVFRDQNNREYAEVIQRFRQVQNPAIHHQLRRHLVESLYKQKEDEERQ